MELWSLLGPDCQERILCRIFNESTSRESAQLRLVSRQWRAASKLGVVFLSPTLLVHDRLSLMFPNLTSMDLTKTISASKRLSVLLKLKYLQSLQLGYLEDEGVEIFTQLTNLRKLDLTRVHLTDARLNRLCFALRKLESLILKSCNVLTHHGIASISEMEHLTELNLDSALMGSMEIDLRPLRKLKRLQTLNVQNCTAIGDGSLESIGGIHSLTDLQMTLRFDLENRASDVGILALVYSSGGGGGGGLPNLKSFSISYSRNYTIESFCELSALTRLERFTLTKADLVKDKVFLILASMNLSLRNLELHGCLKLSQSMMHLTALTRLSSIQLGSGEVPIPPRILEDDALASLAILTNLSNLKISGYTEFTGKTIWQFSSLTSLHLIACCDVKDRYFTALSNLYHLKALTHRYCDGLTDDSFASIASIRSLRYLSISENSKILGWTLIALSALTGLIKLKLMHCSKLQDQGILQLAHMGNLESIDLTGSQSLTEQGVKQLHRANPKIAIQFRHVSEYFGGGGAMRIN
eukprot:g7524.t1